MIAGISGNSAVSAHAAQPAHTQAAANPQPTNVSTPAYNVDISKQALKLASDGDTQQQEVQEKFAEAASEKLRGKA